MCSSDLVIEGNVNIPGNVDAHIVEVGNSGALTVPWMPVSIDGNADITGNVTLNAGTNYVGRVRLTDGTNNVSLELPNNDGEPGSYSVPVENYNMVYNGTSWDRLRGDTTNGAWVNVKTGNITANANVTGGNINANVSGTVASTQDGDWTVSLDGNLAGITANVTEIGRAHV